VSIHASGSSSANSLQSSIRESNFFSRERDEAQKIFLHVREFRLVERLRKKILR
jgi:hypothetical protein